MANTAALTIKVTADTSAAVTGLDQVARKQRDLGKAAKDTAGDLGGADTASKKVGESTGRLAGVFDKAGVAAGKFKAGVGQLAAPAKMAIVAIGGIAVAAGKMAADAEQNVGAVRTVFGDAAGQVEGYSRTAANAVGMSASSYNQLAAATGGALKQAGYSQDELAKKTHGLMVASADLASVFGGDATEAAGAMGAAFRGEFDSLERFGVFLNQNAVDMELARTGQDKLTGAALEAAKKQATYNLIMKQAGQYQGNFAREANTAAGAQQRMRAAFQDAAAGLGEMLLPVMTRGAQLLAQFIGIAQRNPAAVKAIAIGVLALAAAIVVLNVAMAANPIMLIAVAIGLVVAGLVYAYQRFAWFREAVNGVWAAIKLGWEGLKLVFAAVVSALSAAWEVIKGVASAVGGFFSAVWAAVQAYVSFMVGIYAAAWNAIKAGAMAVVNAIVAVWSGIVGFFAPIVNAVIGLFRSLWGLVGALAGLAVAVVTRVWGTVFGFINSTVIQPIRAAFSAVWAAVQAATSAVVGAIRSLWAAFWGWLNGSVIQPIRSAFSAVWAAVTGIVSSAVGTITGVINRIRSTVAAVAGAIAGPFRSAWGTVTGIVQGAVDRIAGMINRIRGMIDSVTGAVGRITSVVRGARGGLGVLRPEDPAQVLPGQPFFLTAAQLLPVGGSTWGRSGTPTAGGSTTVNNYHQLEQHIEVRDTDDARLVARLAADEWRWATTARAVA